MRLEINPDAKITWHTIGPHQTLVMEVDDFLRNADELRSLADTLEYDLPPPGDHYPGYKATAHLGGFRDVAKWVGEQMLGRMMPNGRPPFITTEDLRAKGSFSVLAINRDRVPANFYDQHTDNRSWLAVVLHLSRDSEGRGTALWEHRPTGLSHWFEGDLVQTMLLEQILGLRLIKPVAEALQRMPGFTTAQLSDQLFLKRRADRIPCTAEEDESWRVLKYLPAKFNRLVAYPTWQIHSVVDTSSHTTLTRENMRLTVNPFVEYPLRAAAIGWGATHPPDFYRSIAGLKG